MIQITATEFKKLCALYELSQRGVGGEKANAATAFEKGLAKHGITRAMFLNKISPAPKPIPQPTKPSTPVHNKWPYEEFIRPKSQEELLQELLTKLQELNRALDERERRRKQGIFSNWARHFDL